MYPFLLTLFSGLATLIGGVVVFLKKDQKKILISSLAFASAVMLSVSILELIPEALKILYSNNKTKTFIILFFYLFIGTLIAFTINKINEKGSQDKIYKVGIVTMISIMLHNIPEGMATFIASNQNIKLGINLAIAIGLHNIPEGISIAIPIYYSTKNKFKALFYTFLAGISEFIGALLTFFFLNKHINNHILAILFAIIAGIMTYIALFELLTTSLEFNKKKRVVLYYILGIIIVVISTYLL